MSRRSILECAATTAALASAVLAVAGCAARGPLHVPSPDWRDQVVYFLMLDRFDDGDPRNNDQGQAEYAPDDGARYSGGDLRGVARRLDYIQGLGATAVWITPPVRHQWWNQASRYGGYHGYWARDFLRVDEHFGTLRDYRGLSRALHGRGMFLVQDVVVNHVADYFGYDDARWRADDPASGFHLQPAGDGATAPDRLPFSLNDARDPAQRDAGIYHWTPAIRDFADRRQELDFQLAGLDDLDTANPRVRRALREAYGYWIREAGVDGFRIDTAFHVPESYFDDFLHAADPAAPGMLEAARRTGRNGFHLFGEGFGTDRAFADAQARKLDAYMREGGTGPNTRLPGMINFPLYGTLGDVFARGRPTAELAHRIRSTMAVHAQPWLMPTFVDNHDVDRFLAGGDEAGLRQALLAIMALPGIPTIYYGTEQGFRGQRAAMFAGGFEAGGRDHFDARAPLYRYLQRAIALRRAHPLFSRGTPEVLAANAAAPGAIAWRMRHEGREALVVLNSARHSALLDNLDTGLAPGARLAPAFSIDGDAPDASVDARGRLSLVLPPRAGFVWLAGEGGSTPPPAAMPVTLAPAPGRASGDFAVHGTAPGRRHVDLVVDGDLSRARRVPVDARGRWSATVDTRDMVEPGIAHALVAWDGEAGVASPRHSFTVERRWDLVADVADPAGDDAGPAGRYHYPDDAGWRAHRQADLRRVRAWASGGALRVELTTAAVTAPWNPANGFDHVAFSLFLELPGREGGHRAMPLQNARLPGDMRWHYRLRAHGWSNALFASEGASDTSEGTPATPAPTIAVDAARDTITFTLPARALGDPDTLQGARLFVSTWDYDGGFRALAPRALPNAFGGGDGARDPLWMDATPPIPLSAR